MLAQFNVILQNPGRPKKIFFLTHGLFMCIQHHCMYTLGLQVPPQKVFGPSKPTPKTFLEGTWSPRDMYISIYIHIRFVWGDPGAPLTTVDYDWDPFKQNNTVLG